MSRTVFLDEIVSIEEIGEQNTIDIECDGNQLFFANHILTHNSGINNSDVDGTNVSDSIGIIQTADLLLAIIVTDELQQRNQILVKQIKNSYNDPTYYSRFYVGVDRSRMKLYDLENSAATTATTKDAEPERLKDHTETITDSDNDYDFTQFKF